jgi:hypothetical protein
MDLRNIEIYKEYMRNKYRIDTIHARGKFGKTKMVFTNRGWMTEKEHNQVKNSEKHLVF